MKRAEIRGIFPEATDDQISKMLEAVHAETDKLKDRVDELEEEVETSKSNAGKDAGEWKKKYEDERDKFAKYKKDQTDKETRESKKEAVKDLMKDLLSDKGIEKVLKYADFESIELDDKGAIKNAASVKKAFSEEWSEYATESDTSGVNTNNPDGAGSKGGGKKMTREEIMKITDASQRQAMIAEHHELFGF